MIQYILISILVYIILIGIIIFLIFLLRRKNIKQIEEYNKKILDKERIIKLINEKSYNQIKEVENEIKKAKNIDDFINIFSKL